jgi:2',3'-cyclic-nucleotide 2'-phosphodiesterase (5'-nucleotidase family)
MKELMFRMGIAALGMAVFGFAPTHKARGMELTVLYSANSSGKLAACSCPSDPYGGLAERVTLLKKLRAGNKYSLLLDAGNMVSLFGDFDDRAACVMRLMNLMKYTAAGVGRQELFHDTRSALTMSRVAKFPFLTASIVRTGGGPVFRPYTIVKAGKITVGIIGLADSSCYFPEIQRKFDYSVTPYSRALPPILKELEKKADFIVVLSQMEMTRSEELLRVFPSVALVIQGYGNRELEKPKRIGRGFLAAPSDRGQFVGVIRLGKTPGGAVDLQKSELVPVLEIEGDRKALDIIKNYYQKRK